MRWLKSSMALLPFILFIGGCAVGYNSTLFMTKSNIGLDIESKPPTAEISIARREGVMAPGFEGGQTPPVISSFRTGLNPFFRFFFGVQSTFAGGDAAVVLSQGPGGPQTGHDSEICLSEPPKHKKFLWWDVSVPEKGEVEPFFFATDTTLGLKLAWSGTTGQFPDTIRLGFNRKEFAWAPLFGTDQTDCKIPGTQNNGTYAVRMPPFLAVLDNDVQMGTPAETSIKWLQYFATGKSATKLANHDDVRRVMMERLDPLVKYRPAKFTDPKGQASVIELEKKVADAKSKRSVGEYDVFLAHNSADKVQVQAIAQALRRRGLNPWLDAEQIPPGRRFQDVIQQAILNVKSVAIFIGLQGLGPWQSVELRSFISQCVARDIPVIPVLLPGVSKIPTELVFLNEFHWVEFSEDIDAAEALDNLEWGITSEHPRRRKE